MRPSERYAAIVTVGNFLAWMSEAEADRVLRLAGSSSMTRGGWGDLPDSERHASIRSLLEGLPDTVLSELLQFIPPPNPWDMEPASTVSAVIISSSEEDTGKVPNGSIFVVHGHAAAARHELVRVLERGTGRDIIVLREQANSGRTILEKFENYAASAEFAVVLLTADDEGGKRASAETHFRGRQNVIFELGFFFGKLGRHRVVVLLEKDVEKPSDIEGLVYIDLDQAGAWKQDLARELEAASIPVDRSRIP